MWTRILGLAVLFTALAHAQERRLIPIDAAPIPAAGSQTRSEVATNETGYVAIWYDLREPSGAKTYAMHFDVAGKPTETWGHSIPIDGADARIASDGSNYLVVANDGNKTRTLLLDERGNPQRHARVIDVPAPTALASNGTSYLLLAREPSTQSHRALLLDLDGRVVRRYPNAYPFVRGLAVDDQKHYRFVVQTGQAFELVTYNDAGELSRFLLDTSDADFRNAYVSDFVAAYSSERVFLAFTTCCRGPNVYVNVFDDAGRRTGAQWSGRAGLLAGAFAQGREFTLVTRVANLYEAARFKDDGSLLQPFTAAYQAAGWSRFITNGVSFLALWEDHGRDLDIYAHAAAAFDPKGMVASPQTLITKSLPGQYDVQIAGGGGHELAVYRDDDGILRAAMDGKPIAFASAKPIAGLAAVQAGSENFLVTWREGAGKTAEALGARISFDGETLDSPPFSLGPIHMDGAVTDQQDIAYVGAIFIVATGDDRALHTVHVSNGGQVSGDRSRSFNQRSAVRWPRILPSGPNVLIAALVGWPGPFIGHPPSWWSVELVRRQDELVRLGGFPVGTTAALGAAIGDRILLAFKTIPAAGELAQTAPDGVHVLLWRYSSLWTKNAVVEPRIAADGDQFVLAWSEHDSSRSDVAIRAVRLDAAANRIGEVIELVAHNAAGAKPSMVSTTEGTRIAYSRADTENAGGAVLAFVQTIIRAPSAVSSTAEAW